MLTVEIVMILPRFMLETDDPSGRTWARKK